VNYLRGKMETWKDIALKEIEDIIIKQSNQQRIKGLDSDDIAQEVRFHIYNKLNKFNPYKGRLIKWSYIVIKYKIISLWRSKIKVDTDWSKKDLLDIEEFLPFPNPKGEDKENAKLL